MFVVVAAVFCCFVPFLLYSSFFGVVLSQKCCCVGLVRAANFLNKGTNGLAERNDVLESQHDAFRETLLAVNPDFQTTKDYGIKAPGTQNLSICSAQITARFTTFAATLEQPFKDCADEFPQPATGWSPNRSKRLGWTLLDAFHGVALQLEKL